MNIQQFLEKIQTEHPGLINQDVLKCMDLTAEQVKELCLCEEFRGVKEIYILQSPFFELEEDNKTPKKVSDSSRPLFVFTSARRELKTINYDLANPIERETNPVEIKTLSLEVLTPIDSNFYKTLNYKLPNSKTTETRFNGDRLYLYTLAYTPLMVDEEAIKEKEGEVGINLYPPNFNKSTFAPLSKLEVKFNKEILDVLGKEKSAGIDFLLEQIKEVLEKGEVTVPTYKDVVMRGLMFNK